MVLFFMICFKLTCVLSKPLATAAGATGTSFRHLTVCQILGYALSTQSLYAMWLYQIAVRREVLRQIHASYLVGYDSVEGGES